jgi:NAD(P)H-dependent FMN reductase
MKALIINGSPHKNGPTAEVLGLIEEKIKKKYEIDRFFAYDAGIKPCRGCFKCRPNGKCVLPADDGQVIGEKIAAADLLVIGSPTYWGNIPAPLKVVFDRNVVIFEHFLKNIPSPKLKGKRAIIAVTCGSPFPVSKLASQGKGAVRALKTVLQSGGVKIKKVINVPSAWNLSAKLERVKRRINRIKV